MSIIIVCNIFFNSKNSKSFTILSIMKYIIYQTSHMWRKIKKRKWNNIIYWFVFHKSKIENNGAVVKKIRHVCDQWNFPHKHQCSMRNANNAVLWRSNNVFFFALYQSWCYLGTQLVEYFNLILHSRLQWLFGNLIQKVIFNCTKNEYFSIKMCYRK